MSWDDFLLKAKNAGYDGIEYGIANNTPAEELEMVLEKLKQLNMYAIAQHHETNDTDISNMLTTSLAGLKKLSHSTG